MSHWSPFYLYSVNLPGASGAGWGLAGAVAVAGDVDVGQLGDCDDLYDGVQSDAEILLISAHYSAHYSVSYEIFLLTPKTC